MHSRIWHHVNGIFRDRSKEVMLQLCKSLIRSKHEYCCALWNPSQVRDIETIEDVQRFFTNRISGMSELLYWDLLTVLNLQSLQRRRERYIIIHTWQTITGHVPTCIVESMYFVESGRFGVQAIILALKKRTTSKVKACYDRSVHVKAAQLWNLLPSKDFDSLDKFKISLSTFLRNFPDKPPVIGYRTANHNFIGLVQPERRTANDVMSLTISS